MNTLSKNLAASLLLLVAPVVALVTASALRSRVPDPLPRHWNLAGEVDGTSPFVPFASVVIIVIAALALVGIALVWLVRDRQLAGFSAPLAGWLAWFMGVLFVGTLWVAIDVPRAEDVRLPVVSMVAAFVVSSAVAWALVKLVPSERDASDTALTTGESTLSLGTGEKVVWVGGAGSPLFGWIGALVAAVGAATLLVSPVTGASMLFAGAVIGLMYRLRMRIDDRGVHVAWGVLGWPRSHTPLSAIEGVGVTEALPGEWGGWGYRVSTRGTAHLVRSGEALLLRRKGRKDLLVTVDGADEAAEVLRALLDRAGSAST